VIAAKLLRERLDVPHRHPERGVVKNPVARTHLIAHALAASSLERGKRFVHPLLVVSSRAH
jgi:hypothetical protein